MFERIRNWWNGRDEVEALEQRYDLLYVDWKKAIDDINRLQIVNKELLQQLDNPEQQLELLKDTILTKEKQILELSKQLSMEIERRDKSFDECLLEELRIFNKSYDMPRDAIETIKSVTQSLGAFEGLIQKNYGQLERLVLQQSQHVAESLLKLSEAKKVTPKKPRAKKSA